MKRTIQIIIIIAAFFCIVQLSKPLGAEIYLKKGRVYVDNDFPFKAIDEYQKAEKLDPVKGRIYFEKGIAYGKISQKNSLRSHKDTFLIDSINTFKTARVFLNDTAVNLYLAAGYETAEEIEKAFDMYRNVIESDPKSKSAEKAKDRLRYVFRVRGDNLLEEGKREEAVKDYEKAVKLNGVNLQWGAVDEYEKYAEMMPDNLIVHYWLGNKYYKQKDMENAVKEFETIRKLGVEDDDVLGKLRGAYYQLGNSLSKMEFPEKAIKNYKKVIEMDPKNRYGYCKNAIYAVSALYQQSGKLDRAVDFLIKLEEVDTTRGEGYRKIGELYEKKGMLNKAIDFYERYLEYRPIYDTGIFYTLGLLYERVGNFEKTIEMYLRFEEIDATRGEGYRKIAEFYKRRSVWDKAIDFYERYLEHRPISDTGIFYTIGLLYKRAGNFEKAIEVYLRLEEMDTTRGQGYYNVAELYKARGMWDKAIDFYERYLEYRPIYETGTFYKLGSLYERVNKFDKAIEMYLRFEEINTTRGQGYYNVGELYNKRGMWDKAINFYQRYLEYRPANNVDIFNRLARLYDTVNNLPKSVEAYMRLEEIDTTRGQGYYNVGVLYENRQMREKAIESYERYLEFRFYSDTGIFRKLGNLYDMTHNLSKAVGIYMRLEEIDTTRGEGYFNIGMLYEKREMWDKAIEVYEKYLKINSNTNNDVYFKVGNLYDKAKNWPMAIEYYQKAIAADTVNIAGLKKKSFSAMARIYRITNDDEKTMDIYKKLKMMELLN